MSVSLGVAAKPGQVAPLAPFSTLPWTMPAEPQDRQSFELSGVVMHFAADRPIYAEGDEARSFYKVISGVVRTCRFLSDGRRQIDAFHMAGEVFGFEAGSDHRMSAEAVSDCTVIAYRRRGLEAMISQDERLGPLVLLPRHELPRTRRVSTRCCWAVAARRKRFPPSCWRQRIVRTTTAFVDLAMSRQDIADYLGLTIETVSRTLSQLERDGTIGLPTARRVVLKDRRALRALNS